jgi:hypothetical protein
MYLNKERKILIHLLITFKVERYIYQKSKSKSGSIRSRHHTGRRQSWMQLRFSGQWPHENHPADLLHPFLVGDEMGRDCGALTPQVSGAVEEWSGNPLPRSPWTDGVWRVRSKLDKTWIVAGGRGNTAVNCILCSSQVQWCSVGKVIGVPY